MKKIKVAPILLICASVLGCKNSTTHRLQFVERSEVFSHAPPQPLMLIVEIDQTGRLSLNKIETGTTADMQLLSEKLEAIFADREKAGINEREVLIDPKTDGDTRQYGELITVLADAKASPIRVIRNDH